MNKIYKILGKRGRITIPYEIRQKFGYAYNDVISFEEKDNTILVKREKVCDSCRKIKSDPTDKLTDASTLLKFLDGLTVDEQKTVLIHLSSKWVTHQGGNPNA